MSYFLNKKIKVKRAILVFAKNIEALTEINPVYYIKNSFYLIINTSIDALSSLLLIIVFTRFSTKLLFGSYSYVISILGILVVFSLPGYITSIKQSAARSYEETLFRGTKIRLRFSFLASVVLIIYALFYIKYANLKYVLLLSAFVFPFAYGIADTYFSYLIGKKNFRLASFLNSVFVLFPILLAIVFIVLGKSLIFIIGAFLVCKSVVNILSLFYLKQKSYSKKYDNDFVKFGRNLSLLNIFGAICAHIDKILVAHIYGPISLAPYALGKTLSRINNKSWTIVSQLVYPKLAEKSDKYARKRVRTKQIYVIGFFIILNVVIILLIPYIVPILFGKEYIQTIIYAQLLIFAGICSIPGLLKLTYMQALKKKGYYISVAFDNMVFLVLLFVLINNFGVIGIIFSRIFANLATSVLVFYL